MTAKHLHILHRHRLAQKSTENQQLMCDYCGKRHRYGLALYCTACHYRWMRHGHPKARALRSRDYRSHKEIALRLLLLNEDHPGILSYREWWKRWCNQAVIRPKATPLAPTMAVLSEDLDSSTEALIRLVGQYLWFVDNPVSNVVPNDTCLGYQWANVLWQMVPKARRKPLYHRERRQAAEYLRLNLWPLMVAFQKAREAEVADRERLHEQFTAAPLRHKPCGTAVALATPAAPKS